MAADPSSEKLLLRRAMRSLLSQITPEIASSAGKRIATLLRDCEAWRSASRIALFSSRPDEVDTTPISAAARVDRKKVLFPRTRPDGGLEFAEVSDPDRLRPGRYGIGEPPKEILAVRLVRGDLVLLPGLAFDRRGGRLGRGGGYYDRAFGFAPSDPLRPTLVGLGFSFQLVERVPMTARDVPMDGISNENELIWARGDGEESRR